ncbi:MAG: LytTR family transcriptional regulator [Lachnospiraceae bacterium]|nr:LytTR family transcriptional regulator [Lachnospiraceae bacterium]
MNSEDFSEKRVVVFGRGSIDFLRVTEIVRVRHIGRNAHFYCSDGREFRTAKRLKVLADELEELAEIFVRVSKTEFVNFKHIRSIKGSELYLWSGEVCAISRGRHKHVISACIEKYCNG